jgi:hypothetical protein
MAQIGVKQAVKVAQEYFSDLTGRHLGLLLEEVELVPEGDGREFWYVTLSFPSDDSPLAPFAGKNVPREYKTLRVDSSTGEVKSMKIRQLT